MGVMKNIKHAVETQTTLLMKKAGLYKETELECSIDEEVVDCEGEEFTQEPYTGIPAPAVLPDDPWFGPTPNLTDKQKDYMIRESEIKQQEMENQSSKEVEDIHQVMYDMATKSAPTTLQIDPPSIGGSENFQEDSWQSGAGR